MQIWKIDFQQKGKEGIAHMGVLETWQYFLANKLNTDKFFIQFFA